ncbi:MAG: VTT domain-containing protein, partial [Patescibacteria group bacterium]
LFSLMAAGFFLIPAGGEFTSVIWHAFVNVALPAGLGLTAGAFLLYAALYFGGEPFIRRWGRYAGITWEQIKRAESKIIRGRADEWLIFVLRVLPFVPNVAVSAVCGVFRYPLKPFLILTFLGGTLRAFIVSLIGWSVGAAYVEYASELSRAGAIAAVIFLLVVAGISVAFVVQKKLAKRG